MISFPDRHNCWLWSFWSKTKKWQ